LSTDAAVDPWIRGDDLSDSVFTAELQIESVVGIVGGIHKPFFSGSLLRRSSPNRIMDYLRTS
jgi:hypothetical protein